MSDNITREPYRNAWYKQLSDAVKRHDEEIAEMTPHLVPNVEEGDNGKILIAGEDGAFDWGQPPEELPIITESDEGKVLKVDEGVPKWLEDSDSEYLLVTITRNGTSPNFTYTADKTYDEIKAFAEVGKCILRYSKSIFELDRIDTNFIRFRHQVSANETIYDTQPTFTRAYVKNVSRNIFEVYNDETVLLLDTRLHFSMPFIISDNEVLTDEIYGIIKDGYSDVTLRFTDSNGTYVMQYEKFENNNIIYSNSVNGYKATIGTDKVVHITEIPKDLFVYVTQSGTSPNFTYTADRTFAEIHSAIENGRNVYVKLTGTNNIYQLFIYSDTVCTFAHFLPNYISVYNDAANSKMLANTATSTNDAFVFQANSITRSNVDFYTSYTTDISATSGTFNDAEFWKIVQVRNVRLRYNGYMMYEYYRDNVNTIKFRDVNNTYELVIDGSNKSYTVTSL